jgi:hypothetical protein
VVVETNVSALTGLLPIFTAVPVTKFVPVKVIC